MIAQPTHKTQETVQGRVPALTGVVHRSGPVTVIVEPFDDPSNPAMKYNVVLFEAGRRSDTNEVCGDQYLSETIARFRGRAVERARFLKIQERLRQLEALHPCTETCPYCLEDLALPVQAPRIDTKYTDRGEVDVYECPNCRGRFYQ